MKNIIKKFIAAILLSVAVIVPVTSCSRFVDYVSQTHIHTTDWKTTDFLTTGTGIATLKTGVDGDTAHFFVGKTNFVIQGRFNGVDTPESTGAIEPWGKAASNFTTTALKNAKLIVLESEREDGLKIPEMDSNGTRYMVWVWVSERTAEEEDGSQLKLLNLQLVQEGYSGAKGATGSVYHDSFYDADAQAQRHKLHIWSKEEDPLFYYGEATITNLMDIFSEPELHLGEKVYVEGVVTRRLGDNAYIQEDFELDDGTIKTYGCYLFAGYKKYSCLRKGNRIGVTGIVAEHYGSYQLTDISYNEYNASKDDMVILETGCAVEPRVITVDEALTGEGMGTLIRINGLRATGGYGGTDEYDKNGNKNDTNSMTIYVKDENNKRFNIRIDKATFIKDEYGDIIRSYKYFENYCNLDSGNYFDFTGLLGRYESEYTGEIEIQLMLVATTDMVYYGTGATN